ncbi:ammonium transporter [Peredibacter starrii]|uniref:Ammonium transporter n=1 Tax=Peredibacter starrii TaxID=28202 RepID=A0AAX4HR04_9BACT|nr:ammonium transporter [Peredibacter starrii]WPU65681.1 ammonium transporter [Peredibacter starrii]
MKPIYLVHLGLIFVCGLLATFLPEIPQAKTGGPINYGDTAWLLTASGLVLLMTPGLSFFYGGMVRKKNMISTMLQSMVALGVISVTWVAIGFSLCFGESIGGIIGNPMTYFMYRGVGMASHPDFAPTIPFALFSLFQLKFAIITPALISGAFAERVKFSSYLIFMFLFSIFIYAPLAHMTWHPDGLLRGWGVLDFAGGTVVHISAGMAALAGSIYLGPRQEINHEAHHIPYVILGTGLLWFGWFGFNAGSSLGANETATLAFMNTNTASAVAMLTWMFLERLRGKKASALGACIGAVVGLVGITPAAGFVSVGAAILIGFISASISNFALSLKAKTDIDDTLDVFPCHGLGGIVGMILTAVFAKDVGLIYGQTTTFVNHCIALILVMLFCFVGSYALYWISNFTRPLRVSVEDETVGLDLSQHGEHI